MNTNEQILTIALAQELNGLTHIYDNYLEVAFQKIAKGNSLEDVDKEKVKKKACEILGLWCNI